MAIIERGNTKATINLSGPEGNAYVLLGAAKSIGEQIGMEKEKIEALTQEMKAGNYDHLITVFDENFGQFVDLILPDGYELNPERKSPPTSKKKSQP